MLKTGCILKEYNENAMRISIMPRHTLSDSKTLDSRITKSSYDEWQTIFAPPLHLIGSYYKGSLQWDEFEKGYLAYLDTIYGHVSSLAMGALGSDIRLLCIEETPEKCHRKILAEKCKEICPELEILIE